MAEIIANYRQRLSQSLSPKRYRHSLEVAAEARRLAIIHGLDASQAELAGLLHDVARDLTTNELIEQAKLYNLALTAEDMAAPATIHAPLGAAILAADWQITDSQILAAVSYHTLAAPAMDDLAKAVYLADIIEPTRREFEGLAAIRQAAEHNLDLALYLALADSISHLEAKGRPVHKQSRRAYEYFKKLALAN